MRQPRRLPESLDRHDVDAFLADLRTHRDRAIVLAMLLGGLRSAEVRRLRLADVDMGRRRVRVVGKGGRERVVPVDAAFFAELAAYLRWERPPGLATPECFVVLRGPTAGQPVTEAGLRSVFRRHRGTSGAIRVRPHRLRHTYGTELAAAGIDLLVLRDVDGPCQPGDHGRLRASVGGASGGRVRRRPRHAGGVAGAAVTAAVARSATDHDHQLVDGYARYCQQLIEAGMISDRALRDRLRLARQFLDRTPGSAGVDEPAAADPAGRPATG